MGLFTNQVGLAPKLQEELTTGQQLDQRDMIMRNIATGAASGVSGIGGGLILGNSPIKNASLQSLIDSNLRQNQAANIMRGSQEFFMPSFEAGQRQLPILEESATAEGFGSNIGDILSGGALDPLIAERQRAADAQMSARGLRRSGAAIEEAANIPAELGLQIEGELNRRRQQLHGGGQASGENLANINTMISQALTGQQISNQERKAASQGNMLTLLGTAAMAFSDPALKDDIETVDTYKGLNVIKWKWNKLAESIYDFKGESLGFNALEVKEKMPDCVGERDGFVCVNYEKVFA